VVAIHYLTALKATKIINPQETNKPSRERPLFKKKRFLFPERLYGMAI
jgi:hypothetical protein